MRAHLAAGLGVAIAAAAFGAGLPFIDASGGYAGLSQRFLPTVVTIGLATCALLLLAGRRTVPDDDPDADGTVDPHDGPRRVAWVAVALLLHLTLIGHVGFVIASTLLMTLVARAYGSARPLRDAVAGAALALPMWLLFSRVLGIALPLLPLAGR